MVRGVSMSRSDLIVRVIDVLAPVKPRTRYALSPAAKLWAEPETVVFFVPDVKAMPKLVPLPMVAWETPPLIRQM